jgi:ABC-type multidrug transport system ATPase subunit
MSNLVLDSASRWFGNVVAVNDVSLTIGPGVTGLLGPNGAGKTTLLAMMAGFLPPSAVTVPVLGLTMPQMMLISVVLPAPLGPSRAKISPLRMSRSTLFKA